VPVIGAMPPVTVDVRAGAGAAPEVAAVFTALFFVLPPQAA